MKSVKKLIILLTRVDNQASTPAEFSLLFYSSAV